MLKVVSLLMYWCWFCSPWPAICDTPHNSRHTPTAYATQIDSECCSVAYRPGNDVHFPSATAAKKTVIMKSQFVSLLKRFTTTKVLLSLSETAVVTKLQVILHTLIAIVVVCKKRFLSSNYEVVSLERIRCEKIKGLVPRILSGDWWTKSWGKNWLNVHVLYEVLS